MRVLSLCSGYGGLELALSTALPNRDIALVAVCDNYGPARRVLAQHWPEAYQFKDVHDLALGSARADVVTFGFPCQDLSRAGHGAGEVTMSYYWNAFVAYPARNIYHRLTHLW